nr:FIST N-terminal domain-containing protein [Thetidibacter halocola]
MRIAQVDARSPDAAARLHQALGNGPFALLCLFASPDADFPALIGSAGTLFVGMPVLGCTTAGELGAMGYEEGQIIAIAFPANFFSVSTYAIEGLQEFDQQAEIDRLIQSRLALASRAPDMASEFAFLMVDGLSLREEHLTAALASGLGPMPLFGGSAGDGTRFKATWLAHDGRVLRDAALVALIRSRCPVRVFSLDHLVPTETRMVVTRADPERRLVQEINAEPAAQEYARLLGKDPNQLSPFIFASHPVVVRLGDSHHVRAIQQVDEDGDLVFFSAINEGMVLTLAQHQDISAHLEQALSALEGKGAPDHVLGCDCILRRIEAGQMQKTHEISDILRRHRVIGFSTYGEQFGALHVNQTLTGVAIYPPEES